MKLLLHMCCGPCSVYPVQVLQDEGVEITGFFYNPNIHPMEEFNRRRENVELFSAIAGIPVEYHGDFMQDVWERFDGEEIQRCRMCYSLRLERAARHAAEKGFDAFSTSLLVSPYQKHEMIQELGGQFAARYGVPFYYRDFRPGFRQGQQRARELGIYRQKYCGCIRSLR